MTRRPGGRRRFGAVLLAAAVVSAWLATPAGAVAAAQASQSALPTSSVALPVAGTAQPAVAGAYVALAPARLLDTRTGFGATKAPVEANSTVTVQVLGRGGVPTSGVGSVVLSLTVTQTAGPGTVRAWPDGEAVPDTSNVNYSRGQTVANAVVSKVGVDGKVALLNSHSQAQLIADVTGYYLAGAAAAPGAFVALPAQRLLDTRSGLGAPRHPVAANTTTSVRIAGRGGVPTGVKSVVLNLTAVAPRAAGNLRASATGLPRSNTSTLNFVAGRTVANLAYVQIGADGSVNLANSSSGTVDLLADVAGYFVPGAAELPGTYVSIQPVRVLDTRSVIGSPYSPVPAGRTITVKIAGAGIPIDGVSAAVLNLTVTAPRAAGYGTAWAAGARQPGTSTVNFAARATVAAFATVPIGSASSINLLNASSGTAQLIADVTGYYLSTPISHVNMRWGVPSVFAQGGGLFSSCASATFCEAVDQLGHVFTFDGQHWSPQANLVPKYSISAISCASSTFCVATDLLGWVFTYTAAGWSAPVLIPGHQTMESVSCLSSTFCMVVDHESNTAVIYNGTGWVDSTVLSWQSPHLLGVACASATSCFAVNGSSTVYHYRGVDFGWVAENVLAADVQGGTISCSGPDLCAVTDNFGHAATFNGLTWSAPVSVDPAMDPNNVDLPVSCGANICLVVDQLGRAFSYNGTRWSAAPPVETAGYSFISCVDRSFCLLTGRAGNAMTFDGTKWSVPTMYNPNHQLNALSCSSGISCAAVGTGGQVRTFDGSSWSGPTSIDPYGYLQSVSCPVAGFCAAVDNVGYVVTSAGAGWTAPVKVDATITGDKSISCASTDFCVVIDQAGNAAVMQGTTWGPLTGIATGHVLKSVSCPSTSFCAAVAADGFSTTFDGHSWAVPGGLRPGSFSAVSCPVAGFCVATAAPSWTMTQGSALLYTGGSWHARSPSLLALGAISCVSTLFCVSVAGPGDLPIFNGATWLDPMTFSHSANVESISCPATTFCAALDNYNGIVIGRS